MAYRLFIALDISEAIRRKVHAAVGALPAGDSKINFVAADNIHLSAAYLGYLLEQTDGDHAAALAAYLLGPTAFREEWYTQDATSYITGVMQARPDFAAPR